MWDFGQRYLSPFSMGRPNEKKKKSRIEVVIQPTQVLVRLPQPNKPGPAFFRTLNLQFHDRFRKKCFTHHECHLDCALN
ncbi:uncharacterized protein EURHEDRAFT_218318 [Aspergillus ruber CBS 135680]|uniref:Uncharacterized protein n=1 Tax=Aspergillus ruber (strain CBS 135680) TaxID=1388766 RepID=A0A017SQS9_ASPRC|nr:uncharacterized protein EURHEDRAFT_218318 [Aspergillus ruber CBS 135680]EYE98605.1 hypothetical protein EURHEDRAFT_218318 [Aspergillus ruber CBS 135680]